MSSNRGYHGDPRSFIGFARRDLVAGQAFVTGQAAEGYPADANSLTDLEAFGSFPEGHHRADRLVPGYKPIFG